MAKDYALENSLWAFGDAVEAYKSLKQMFPDKDYHFAYDSTTLVTVRQHDAYADHKIMDDATAFSTLVILNKLEDSRIHNVRSSVGKDYVRNGEKIAMIKSLAPVNPNSTGNSAKHEAAVINEEIRYENICEYAMPVPTHSFFQKLLRRFLKVPYLAPYPYTPRFLEVSEGIYNTIKNAAQTPGAEFDLIVVHMSMSIEHMVAVLTMLSETDWSIVNPYYDGKEPTFLFVASSGFHRLYLA